MARILVIAIIAGAANDASILQMGKLISVQLFHKNLRPKSSKGKDCLSVSIKLLIRTSISMDRILGKNG